MAKRKREVGLTSPLQSVSGAIGTSPEDKQREQKKRRDSDDPKIVYELADGSKRLDRRLSKDKTLLDALYKVTKKLEISTPGSIRLTEVRQGGREVEIYDEFDYKALRTRAKALGSETILIKVYPGGRPAEPLSLPSSAYSTPSHAGPSSTPISPTSPRSILSTSHTPSTPTQSSGKGKKRVSIVEPNGTSSTPTKRSSSSPSNATTKGKAKAKDQNATGIPVLKTNGIVIPEGMVVNSKALDILSRYKPFRSSPLSKSAHIESDTSDAESSTKVQDPQSPTAGRRRRRKSRTVDRQADPSSSNHQESSAESPSTSSIGNPSTPVPISESPPKPKSSSPISESTSNPEQRSNTTPSKGKRRAKERSRVAEPQQPPQQPDPAAQIPILQSSPVASADPQTSDEAQSAAPVERALPEITEPSASPSDLLTPHDYSEANRREASAPSELQPTPSKSSTSKPRIFLASPWVLYGKPEDPAPNHSSSSFNSPTKASGKKGKGEAAKSSQKEVECSESESAAVIPAGPSSNPNSTSSIPIGEAANSMQQSPEADQTPARAVDIPQTPKAKGKRGKRKADTAANQSPSSTQAEAGTQDAIADPATSTTSLQIQNSPVTTPPDLLVESNVPASSSNDGSIQPVSPEVSTPLQSAEPNSPSTSNPQLEVEPANSSATPSKGKGKGKKADKPTKPNTAKEIMAQYRAKQAAEVAEEAPPAAVEQLSPEAQTPEVTVVEDAPESSTSTRAEVAEDIVEELGKHNKSVEASLIPATPADRTPNVAASEQPIESVSPRKPASTPSPIEENEIQSPETDEPVQITELSPSPSVAELPNGEAVPSVEPEIRRTTRQRKSEPQTPIVNGTGESPRPSSARSAKSAAISPSVSAPSPTGWWANRPEGMTKGGRVVNAILASRAVCIICGSASTHMQVDCPEVKKGRENLEQLLEARQAQAFEEEEELAKRALAKKPKGRKSAVEDDEPVLGMAKESVETIKGWIARLEAKEVHRKVETQFPPGSPKFKPHPVWGQKQPTAQSNGNAPSASTSTTKGVIEDPTEPEISADEHEFSNIASASDAPVSSQPDSRSHVGDASIDSVPEDTVEEVQQPLATPTEEEAMSSFPLHQLALQRMRTRKRPGSLSGLSASDAVIETGDSDSDSSEEDISTAPRSPIGSALGGHPSDSDSDSASSNGDQDEEDASEEQRESSGPLVEDQPESEDGDNEDSDSASRASSPSSASNSASRSSSSTSSSSSRSSSPSSDSLPDDPEASFRHFLSQPLSAKEKKRARESAASATPSQHLDIDIDMDELPSEAEDIDEDETPVLSQAKGRRGSDSSIDVGHGDDEDERMDLDDEILPSSLTQPPTLAQSDVETDNAQSEVEDDDTSKKSSRSFVNLDREAGPSPTVDTFEGAIALQEAIAEEEPTQVLVDETMKDDRSQHVNSQGLPSPPSSNGEDLVATQIREENTPRFTRSRLGRGTVPSSLPSESLASQESTSIVHSSQTSQFSQPGQASQASQDSQSRRVTRGSTIANNNTSPYQSTQPLVNGTTPVDTPRRRLRSSSRDIPDSLPSPRVTRRASASQQPTSPKMVKANGISRSQPVASVPASPDQPRRMTRSRSQATPDRAPAPPSSSMTGLQLENIDEQDTPKASKIDSIDEAPMSQIEEQQSSAIIPEAQESESESMTATPTAKGKTSKTQPSPLFMSQGSQPLATQHYTLQDSSLATETPVGKSSNANPRTTSPIPEEDEDASVVGENDDESQQSSSDSEVDIPIIQPIRPIRRTMSQGPPVLAMPTLSSLDTSVLRARNPRTNGRNGASASQPVGKVSKSMVESESEVSSSDEDEVPTGRKGRYATGRVTRGTKPKTKGVMRGW